MRTIFLLGTFLIYCVAAGEMTIRAPFFIRNGLGMPNKHVRARMSARMGILSTGSNSLRLRRSCRLSTELYWTGLANGRRRAGGRELIPIDLLRPFTVAGHGPCYNFPRTCPWDIGRGETVALAIQKSEFGAHKALFCRRISRLTNEERQETYRRSKSITKYEAILPYASQTFRYLSQNDNREFGN